MRVNLAKLSQMNSFGDYVPVATHYLLVTLPPLQLPILSLTDRRITLVNIYYYI